MKHTVSRIFFMVAIVAAFSGCQPNGEFVPLPPPAYGSNLVAFQMVEIGDMEQVVISNPDMEIAYTETMGNATEIARFYEADGRVLRGTMIREWWGSWWTEGMGYNKKGAVHITKYFGPDKKMLGGMIRLEVPEFTLFQLLLTGNIDYTINRSSLNLNYYADGEGGLRLDRAYYFEEWGLSNNNKLAMGLQAYWDGRSFTDSKYMNWGFWENSAEPFLMVDNALRYAREKLSTEQPIIMNVDQDGTREIIGRQTGMKFYLNGDLYGIIDFEYKNMWGVQPNTNLFANGSLSMVEWEIKGYYYALMIISPKLAVIPTSLYIFTGSRDAVTAIDNMIKDREEEKGWGKVYTELNKIGGVDLVIYAAGSMSSITADDETIGKQGGLNYMTLGTPKFEEIKKAFDHIQCLGKGGIKALGFYYPNSPGGGSGLHYYLSQLMIMTAKPEERFRGDSSISVLDQPGFLNPDSIFAQPAPAEKR